MRNKTAKIKCNQAKNIKKYIIIIYYYLTFLLKRKMNHLVFEGVLDSRFK